MEHPDFVAGFAQSRGRSDGRFGRRRLGEARLGDRLFHGELKDSLGGGPGASLSRKPGAKSEDLGLFL